MSTKQPNVPRGIRNNNPLNIRLTATRWVGMRANQTDKGFCQYCSMAYGWRAAFMLLFSYYHKHGLKTVRDIISRWAPPSDGNDTEKYIRSVVHHLFWLDEHLKVTDNSILDNPREKPWLWFSLATAMFMVEQGGYDYDLNDVLSGFALAYNDYKVYNDLKVPA